MATDGRPRWRDRPAVKPEPTGKEQEGIKTLPPGWREAQLFAPKLGVEKARMSRNPTMKYPSRRHDAAPRKRSRLTVQKPHGFSH